MKKPTDSSSVRVEGSTISGSNINIAGRDIIQPGNTVSGTQQDFMKLLMEIQSTLKKLDLDPDDKQGIEANLTIAKNQATKAKPNGTTIVSSLTTALNLITQAGGAAKAIETILPMVQKAIEFAQKLFS